MMDKLLTVAEAAEVLRLAPGTVYHLLSRHALPCVRLSKRCVRFRQSELESWISSHSEIAGDEDVQLRTRGQV
jgi:excisionase family DNA binding protein